MNTIMAPCEGLRDHDDLGFAEHDALPCVYCAGDPLSSATGELAELESGWPSPLTDGDLQLVALEPVR